MEKRTRFMRRIWKEVAVVETNGGFGIALDGRPLKTPMKADLLLTDRAMADVVASEWEAVGETVNPAAMPITGFANAAIDRVGPERDVFIDAIAGYAETDCFCYRAEDQDALLERQQAIWDPWLNWARARYGVEFILVYGIMHQPQSEATLIRLRTEIAERSDFELAALSKLAHLAGSLVAVLAVHERAAEPQALWDALCVDEDWQAEQWGADDYAIKHRRDREREFLDAARFLAMVTQR
jgi:chaperone required for assembly of F1-ATPase